MRARHASKCPGCGDRIDVGDWIVPGEDGWVHAYCADEPIPPARVRYDERRRCLACADLVDERGVCLNCGG